jgi:hypothetical protein
MAKPLPIMLGKALGKLGDNNQHKGQGQGQAHSIVIFLTTLFDMIFQ